MHLSKAPQSFGPPGASEVGSRTPLGEQKRLAELVYLLGVCEDLECTPRVLDFKLKWPGVSSRK